MDIASTFAARRICYLADRPFWVRPMDWRGWSEVIAWLDDMVPGRSERECPPRLGSEASQELLRSDSGRALLAWIALRDEGIRYEEATVLWVQADEEERHRLLSVLMGRRRSLVRGSGGTDLGEVWCGKGMAQLGQMIGMEALSRLTLDQAEWLLSEGECDQHADPAVKARIDLQRQWQEANARWKAEQVAIEAGAKPETES